MSVKHPSSLDRPVRVRPADRKIILQEAENLVMSMGNVIGIAMSLFVKLSENQKWDAVREYRATKENTNGNGTKGHGRSGESIGTAGDNL